MPPGGGPPPWQGQGGHGHGAPPPWRGPPGGWPPPPYGAPPPRSSPTCLIAAVIAALGVVGIVVAGAVAAVWLGHRPATPALVDPRPGGDLAPPLDPEPPATPPGSDDEPPPPPGPEVPTVTMVSRYSIHGATAAELRADLDAKGPTDRSGRHDAMTSWYVRWSYPTSRGRDGCSTGPVRVDVTITYTMPEWTPPPGADPALVGRWRRYEASLERHEEGHASHGIAAGREVLEELQRVAPRASCDRLDADVNAAGHRILDIYRARDVAYDDRTRHGATQGARFP